MGVSITATNSSYDFDMGYGGFFNLRKNIAMALNKDFGENYQLLSRCFTKKQFEENDRAANYLIEKYNLDTDIIDFLYMQDVDGEISYKTCKKIYDLIKDIDFDGKTFRYAAYAGNDYEDFKMFLKECYRYKRKMRWH